MCMYPSSFTIDFIADKTFNGYTRREDWNGFACPYFSFEQAQHLAEEWSKTGFTAQYDEASDVFIFGVDVGGGAAQEETEEYPAVEIEGAKYYPIGAFCWIWQDSRQDQPIDSSKAGLSSTAVRPIN